MNHFTFEHYLAILLTSLFAQVILFRSIVVEMSCYGRPGDRMALARNLVQQYHARRAANPAQFPSRAKARPRSQVRSPASSSKKRRTGSEGTVLLVHPAKTRSEFATGI